jgi:hypothetical protein
MNLRAAAGFKIIVAVPIIHGNVTELIHGNVTELNALRRSFFENGGHWVQRHATSLKNASRPVQVDRGLAKKLTQAVDFHDNSGKFQIVFWRIAFILIAAIPPIQRYGKSSPDSRRCGVFVFGQRFLARAIKANQTQSSYFGVFVFFASLRLRAFAFENALAKGRLNAKTPRPKDAKTAVNPR